MPAGVGAAGGWKYLEFPGFQAGLYTPNKCLRTGERVEEMM